MDMDPRMRECKAGSWPTLADPNAADAQERARETLQRRETMLRARIAKEATASRKEMLQRQLDGVLSTTASLDKALGRAASPAAAAAACVASTGATPAAEQQPQARCSSDQALMQTG